MSGTTDARAAALIAAAMLKAHGRLRPDTSVTDAADGYMSWLLTYVPKAPVMWNPERGELLPAEPPSVVEPYPYGPWKPPQWPTDDASASAAVRTDGPDPALRTALLDLAAGLTQVANTLTWQGNPGDTGDRLVALGPMVTALGAALRGSGS